MATRQHDQKITLYKSELDELTLAADIAGLKLPSYIRSVMLEDARARIDQHRERAQAAAGIN